MSLEFVTLDVFTTTKFYGNPVAIVRLPGSTNISEETKLRIAKEFNLVESVFLHEQTAEERACGDIRIQIFTTTQEIPFAGHPTVGTSNYLLNVLQSTTAKTLVTKAGRIPIQSAWVEESLGVRIDVAHNFHVHNDPFKGTSYSHYPVVSIVNGMNFILAKLDSLDELADKTETLVGTANSYKSARLLDEGWQNGPVVTYWYVDLGLDASGIRQLRTRGMAGVEDPATGSAASGLCCWLTLKEGATEQKFKLNQGVEMGRSSFIHVQVSAADGKIQGVKLSGTAVPAMKGQIEL